MVLTIVSTIKTKKSTTINTIINTKILPNHNHPITTLPTLIHHTPKQKKPILHFSHITPINCLIQQLQQHLHNYNIKHLTNILKINKNIHTLIQQIKNNITFKKYYLNTQPIFHYLKNLNNLIQLTKTLNINFPFSTYTTIKHIPIIKIKFIHLTKLKNYPNQLTLLNTPKPNKTKQPHLQKILNQQLTHTSTILTILNYTQLKSISNKKIHKTILTIKQSIPLYILINKFNQQNHNNNNTNQIQTLISKTLIKNYITPQQIFPISSI